MTATPATGSTFTGWSGACTGKGTTCTVSMTVDRATTVTFTSSVTLYTATVTKAGTGAGTVISNPAGVNCGTTCVASFASGTSAVLTATPATGSTFTGWSGACTGTGTCTLSMKAAKAVTATFTLVPVKYAATVTKAGTGAGTVTSSPAGISCGTTCSFPFTSGASVLLTAVPATGSTFTGWTGACTGTGICLLSMTADRAVTATFVPAAKAATTLAYTGPTIAEEGVSIKLSAKLVSGTTVVSGASVTFTLAGKTYTATTNTCGIATVTVTAPKVDGYFPIRITFAGSATFAASTSTVQLFID
ncbi:MAG: hypothetical protein WCK58_18865 [Chloroflexota bacterium]